MDTITNKALIIGVGIFITVAITSGIMLAISNMKDVYERVYKTNISLHNDFSEFDKYDNTQVTGIDVVNTINKYVSYDNVYVYIGNYEQKNKTTDEDNKSIIERGSYKSEVAYINDDVIKITFVAI